MAGRNVRIGTALIAQLRPLVFLEPNGCDVTARSPLSAPSHLPKHVYDYPVSANSRELQEVDPLICIDPDRCRILKNVENANAIAEVGIGSRTLSSSHAY